MDGTDVTEPHRRVVHLDAGCEGEAEIHVAVWGEGPPQIVLLHDGLGSISQWRGVPAEIARRTGATVLAYDRPGHGASLPVPTGPWPIDWLRIEADRLDALLVALDASSPVLVGHSDGGSIALLHAARHNNVSQVLAIAAHSWREAEAADQIQRLCDDPDGVIAGLGRHHGDPAAIFEAWSGVWTSVPFETWDIRHELTAISVPCHIVQGDADEYGTSLQATETAAVIGPNAHATLIAGGRHLLHHQRPDVVVDLVVERWSAS